VVLLGWVDNAGTAFIPYVDIFFLPSRWEAMSVVVLEAMEAGKPVVVTNVGENNRVIEHGVDGWVVEPRDVESMAAILERLIGDHELRARAGARAQAKARTQFSVEKMVAAYEALYENKAGGGHQGHDHSGRTSSPPGI
jgi:glycosyltransferase involved in cell wall biosynthesis